MFAVFQNNCSAEAFKKQVSQEPIKQRGRRKEEIEDKETAEAEEGEKTESNRTRKRSR